MSRRRVVPGSLVRAKRNMSVSMWDHVERDLNDRLRMKGSSRAMRITTTAFVIGSLVDDRDDSEGAAMVWLPKSQKYKWTWASYLMAIDELES